MRLIPQCFGPEELGIALRLCRVLPFMGSFADLNLAPALDAYRLFAVAMHELGAPPRRTSLPPYVAGLTRYVVGEGRPLHVDASPTHGLEHHRLVVLLHPAHEGGELLVGGVGIGLASGDGVVFRADTTLHEIRPVKLGLRLGLTIGVLL